MRSFTSREFRANQAQVFALADAGETIVIRRRGKQDYTLTPVDDDDFQMTPQLMADILKARRELAEGRTRHFETHEEMQAWLDSL
ncbi:MAG: type II toxin-antitoxin system Phd/YefM family antitoxin [Bacteroidales bacterium]|nr:type II toxin-antitoxin system Phd/YefM family antitoxin [Bacteroidales bacterium]